MTKTATKQSKVHSVYEQKYNKGVTFNDLSDIYNALKKKGIVVYPINAGINSDDTEYMTIKIDRIDVSDKK